MRKEKTVTIDDRGTSLTFKIKEMPALKLESWILRAVMLLAGSGLLDKELADRAKEAANSMQTAEAMSSVGSFVTEHGLKALASVEYEKAEPLLAELLACCSRVDGGVEQRLDNPVVVEGIISDVRTLFKLRKEAFALNFDFFVQGSQSATDVSRTQSEGSHRRQISVQPRP